MSNSVHLAQDIIRSWQTAGDLVAAEQHPAPAKELSTEQKVCLGGEPSHETRLNLEQTLRRRRSLRFFAETPLPAEAVVELISSAVEQEKRGRTPENLPLPELEITVAALRLDGLDPGFHRIDPAAQTAAKIAAPFDEETIDSLTLQAEFANAAVIISLGGDLATAEARAGTHGYRLLMQRASAAAYGIWLDGVSRGWVGSVFAGLLPATLRQSVASDGTSRHQLFALALGSPPAMPTDAADSSAL